MYTRWIIWGGLLILLLFGCKDGDVMEPNTEPLGGVFGITPSFNEGGVRQQYGIQQNDSLSVRWSDTVPPLSPGGAIGKGVVVVPVVPSEYPDSRFYAISYGDYGDAAFTFRYSRSEHPTADVWLYSGTYDWRYERITHFGLRVNTIAPSGRRYNCMDSIIIIREVITNTLLSIGQEPSTAILLPRPLRREVLQGQEGYLPEYAYMGHSRDRIHVRLSVLQLWDCTGRRPNPVQFIFDFYNERGDLAVSTPCSIGFIPSGQ